MLGPIRTRKKVVYLDKFSVVTNALQEWMVCHDLKNFVRSRQIFKGTANKICPAQNLDKIDSINKIVLNLSIMCHKSYYDLPGK